MESFGKITVDRTTFGNWLSESFHTAFRKGDLRSPESSEIWRLIQQLPNEDWTKAIEWVMFCLETPEGNGVIRWVNPDSE